MNDRHLVLFVLLDISLVSVCSGIYTPERANLNTLQLVQVVHRHGDKNPELLYPNDPYSNDTYWPGGWGQLTDLGVHQTFELGKFLRARYGSFLSDYYDMREIYAMSSDSERTIRSALSNLAGFYGLDERNGTGMDEAGKIPTIRTLSLNLDNCFALTKPCPAFDAAHQDYLQNSEFAKGIYLENKEIFEYISLHSGWNLTYLDKRMGYFYDGLKVEETRNYSLPNWTLPIFTPHLNNLTAISLGIKTHDTYFQRMSSGPLLKIIQNNIKVKIGKVDWSELTASTPYPYMYNETKKMIIFTGHDTSLVRLMNTWGVYELIRPPFASAILIELHKKDSEYYLKFLIRNETEHDPYILPVFNEESTITLKNYLNKIHPVIPDDWENECQSGGWQQISAGESRSESGILLIFFGGIFGLVIIIIIALSIQHYIRRNSKQYKSSLRHEYTPFLE